MNDPFYIGWESKSDPGIAKFSRWTVILLALAIVLLATLFSTGQKTIGLSVFEWGNLKTFSGTFVAEPYPHLQVQRPGATDKDSAFSSYCLVAPWKFGLDPKTTQQFDGKYVSLKGTLIHRTSQTMIETRLDWITVTNQPDQSVPASSAISVGKQTFVGEIVDSKCYFGVMNPGQYTPHRACAIRCISGGCPPLLLVHQKQSPDLCMLLVSPDGKPVNKQALNYVAEPVQITGELIKQGDLMILRADPATYQRL